VEKGEESEMESDLEVDTKPIVVDTSKEDLNLPRRRVF
jgi:hypothetical protein